MDSTYPIVHHGLSPYNAFDNNPVFWADPSGADSEGGSNSTRFTIDAMGRQKFDEYENYIMPGDRVDNLSTRMASDDGVSTNSTGGGITIRIKDHGVYYPIIIIETELMEGNIDVDIESLPDIDILTKNVRTKKPIVMKGLDDFLKSQFDGLPDAVYVNIGAQLIAVSSGVQLALFLKGKDAGGVFLYTPKNPVDPTVGIIAGGGIELGGIQSKVNNFNRLTLSGKSINGMVGLGKANGTVTLGMKNSYLDFMNPTYIGISGPIYSGNANFNVKYGGAASFSESQISATIINPK